MRLSLLTITCILIALLCGVFTVADKVQLAERKQKSIERKIALQREGVRVLQAEWTYLTNPDRLQRLAVDHFKLEPTDGRQYIELAAIPMRDFVEQQQAEAPALLAENTVKMPPVALPPSLQALPTLQPTPVNAFAGMRP